MTKQPASPKPPKSVWLRWDQEKVYLFGFPRPSLFQKSTEYIRADSIPSPSTSSSRLEKAVADATRRANRRAARIVLRMIDTDGGFADDIANEIMGRKSK